MICSYLARCRTAAFGLTLLELLVAAAMLSVLAVASVSLGSSYAGRARGLSEEANWKYAAEASIDVLADDLRTGDWWPARHRSSVPKLRIEDGVLNVRTRVDGAPRSVRYLFDPDAGTLSRASGDQIEVLLGDIGSMEWEFGAGAQESSADGGRLLVTIERDISLGQGRSVSASEVLRELVVPGGWPR